MSEDTLSRALREAYEQTVENAPTDHPQRTGDCPSIPRFANAMRDGWSTEDRRHVSGCPYCQKLTAFHWTLNPPGLWSIAQFVAGVSPDNTAMRLYMDRDPKARRLQDSVFVRKLAGSIKAVKRLSSSLDALQTEIARDDWFGLNSLAFARGRGAMRASARSPEDELNRVRDWSNAVAMSISDKERTSELRVRTPDGSLNVCVSAVTDGIEIRATSPGIENAGRRVMVELLPQDDDAIRVELRMAEDKPGDIARAQARVATINGPEQLSRCSLLAAWIS